MYIELIKSVALLLALSILYGLVLRLCSKDGLWKGVILGGLFGAIAVVVMMTPIQLQADLIFDPRSVVISLGGFFGGPIVAVVSAIIAGSYRFWIGGSGVFTGTLVIVVCALMGVGYRYIVQHRSIETQTWHFGVFGIVVHVAVILCMFTLPAEVSWSVVSKITIPFLLIFPPATLLLGYFLLDIEQRLQIETTLENSESRMRTLIETLPDQVWLKDPDGVFLACNQKFERLYGHKEAEIIGKTDYDFVDKALADFFRERDCAAVAAKVPIMNEEKVTYADDGHMEVLETIKTPIFGQNGELVGVLGVGRDITGRKKMQQTLSRSQKMDAIGQMAGGIAHDFNNILGIVIGNVNLLKRRVKDDDQAVKRIETIKKSAQRAADLTKQLLSFSRQESAQISTADISQVIEGMDNLVARSVTPEVEVVHKLTKGLWLAELDLGDFEDALLNLILNARDAMPNSGILTIETKNRTLDSTDIKSQVEFKSGDYIELSIGDAGSGISKENLEHIYEPFFSTKPQGKGTGLGLSMVFGFIQRSGGHIIVNSELGVGTTFFLYLPRSNKQEDQAETHFLKPDVLPRGHETILVVDDEDELLLLAKESLQDLGYQVVTAGNGQHALEQLVNEPSIAILFSDVVMPGGMTGYELAEQAVALRPDLKVLLTSGYTGKSLAKNHETLLDAQVLSKPYDLPQLAKRLQILIAGA